MSFFGYLLAVSLVLPLVLSFFQHRRWLPSQIQRAWVIIRHALDVPRFGSLQGFAGMGVAVVVLALTILPIPQASADEVPIWVEPGGSHRTGQAFPLPTANAPTYGFLNVATPTIAVSANTAAPIGTLPAGTHIVRIYARFADVNYGPSGVGSGTAWNYVASGSISDPIPVATLTPGIFTIGRSGAASATIYAQ